MRRISHIFRKACSASPHEWRTRGAQAAFHLANLLNSRFGRSAFPDDRHRRSLPLRGDALAQWWSARCVPWQHFTRLNEARLASFRTHPEYVSSQLNRAAAVAEDKFPLFSYPPVDYSGPERWRTDTILGVTSPLVGYPRIAYLDCNAVGDSKFVWEPNRCGWMYWLITADLLNVDSTCAETAERWWSDWLDQNPYPFGINYCSSLEIALRNYAWLWGLHHFRDHLADRPELLDRVVQAIWAGARHLERTLSYYFAPNTHLLGEAFGLFATGALFPEFAESGRWRRIGGRVLANEADRQLHLDGTHRELSTSYHLYTTDFYVHAWWLARLTGAELPVEVGTAALRLANRLNELTPNSGILPQLNDCDGGRLTGLQAGPLDARSTLLAARHLLGSSCGAWDTNDVWGDHLWIENSTAPHWQAEAAAKNHLRRDKHLQSPRTYDSGLVVQRSEGGDYLLFRSGPFGYLDCGHSHDGQLGVTLYLGGQPVLVDGGCGAYTQDLDLRNRFRSATGRNVMLINGNGPSVPGGWFTWERRTDGQLLAAEQAGHGSICRGQHTGYTASCGFPVQVEREVRLLESGICLILDRWHASRPVSVTACWTLAPDLRWEDELRAWQGPTGNPIWWATDSRTEPLPVTEGAEVGGLKTEQCRTSYSPDYGTWTTTSQLTVTAPAACRGELVTAWSRLGPIDSVWSLVEPFGVRASILKTADSIG